MAKRLMVLVATLAMLLAVAVPAPAQEEGKQDTAASSGDAGEAGGKSSGGPGGIRVLPATGSAPLAMLGSGILLIAGGLLARGIFR